MNGSPVGATAPRSLCRPYGASILYARLTQGCANLRFAPPWAIIGRPFGAKTESGSARLRLELAPFAEPVAEEVLQLGDGVNLVARRLPVVLDAVEAHVPAVHGHVASPGVPVARLAHRADVDDGL